MASRVQPAGRQGGLLPAYLAALGSTKAFAWKGHWTLDPWTLKVSRMGPGGHPCSLTGILPPTRVPKHSLLSLSHSPKPPPSLQNEATDLPFRVCIPLSSLSLEMGVEEEIGEKEEKKLGWNKSPHLNPGQCRNPADAARKQDE